jgi:hypothetical protein
MIDVVLLVLDRRVSFDGRRSIGRHFAHDQPVAIARQQCAQFTSGSSPARGYRRARFASETHAVRIGRRKIAAPIRKTFEK